jgi:hypothetical protein
MSPFVAAKSVSIREEFDRPALLWHHSMGAFHFRHRYRSHGHSMKIEEHRFSAVPDARNDIRELIAPENRSSWQGDQP